MAENRLESHHLPAALRQQIDGVTAHRILLGESGTSVYRLLGESSGTRYLKIAAGTARRELHLERDRLVWLQGKLPVPQVLYFGENDVTEYLLLSAVEGLDASQLTEQTDPVQLVAVLAGSLRQIHALDIRDCPFERRLDTVLAQAKARIENREVADDDLDDEARTERMQRLYEQAASTRPRTEDLVFVHGDYCFPNILLDPQTLTLTGFIDWGRSGIADRYQDLALAARSIIRNLSERWVGHFFDAYGLERVDSRKVRFYQLLDDVY